MKILFGIVVMFLLVGCAGGAANIRELKAEPYEHEVVYMDISYKEAYRRVAKELPICKYMSPMTIPMNIFEEHQEGEISVLNELGTFLRIEVKGVAENKSRVDIYTSNELWSKHIVRVKGWLNQTAEEC